MPLFHMLISSITQNLTVYSTHLDSFIAIPLQDFTRHLMSLYYKDSQTFETDDCCHPPNFLHRQHGCLEICDYINVIPGYRSADLSQTTCHDLTDCRLPFGNKGFEIQLPAAHVYIGSIKCI